MVFAAALACFRRAFDNHFTVVAVVDAHRSFSLYSDGMELLLLKSFGPQQRALLIWRIHSGEPLSFRLSKRSHFRFYVDRSAHVLGLTVSEGHSVQVHAEPTTLYKVSGHPLRLQTQRKLAVLRAQLRCRRVRLRLQLTLLLH